MSREAKILGAILIVVVGGLIGLFVVANKSNSSPPPVGDKSKIIRDTSHKEGSGSVQLVEFGDFQCPACGNAYSTVEQLKKDYNGKVTFYFRNFPLQQHPLAQASAEAAEAAGAQGKYWEMYNQLYAHQKDWGDLEKSVPKDDAISMWVGYAKQIGLNTDKFKQDIQNEAHKSVIDQDQADGNALGINATPSIYVNGTQVQAFDYPSLRDAIEAQLNKNPTPSPGK